MNAGDLPGGAPANRRDLIEALENLGYDCHPGVASDWRDTMQDDAMRVAVAMLDCDVAFVDDDGNFGVEGDDGRVIIIDPAEDDEAEFPDIGDLVAAIDEIVASRDAFAASMTVADAARQDRAYGRCRELQKQIARAQEALHA